MNKKEYRIVSDTGLVMDLMYDRRDAWEDLKSRPRGWRLDSRAVGDWKGEAEVLTPAAEAVIRFLNPPVEEQAALVDALAADAVVDAQESE